MKRSIWIMLASVTFFASLCANLYAAWGRPARASEYLAELERVRAAT